MESTEILTKTDFPEYRSGIVSVANSIMKYYGLEPYHATNEILDAALCKNSRNVVFMIFDAMGMYNLSMHLPENSFLRTHIAAVIPSVYPPTTVAATTVYYSGLQPCETGWLGWTQYFSEIDENVVMFLNKNDEGESAADFHVAHRYVPHPSIINDLRQHFGSDSNCPEVKRVRAESISLHGTVPYNGITELFSKVEEFCSEQGRHYLECYFKGPDNIMHKEGVDSPNVRKCIRTIDKMVEEYSEKLNKNKDFSGDTLFIVTADHGHINSVNSVITDYPEIMKCLKRLPSLEPRTPSFFVKDGRAEQFKKEFLSVFGNDFLLLTRQEVIDKKVFGSGPETDAGKRFARNSAAAGHKPYTDFLGDYIAFAVGSKAIVNNPSKQLKGHHAGLTKEELMVPLIIAQ